MNPDDTALEQENNEQPTLATEVAQLLNELKSNNSNGNEIIAVLTAERNELREQLEEVRDTLLEMLTRTDSTEATEA